MEEKRLISSLSHNIMLEDRKKLTASAVADVDNFDEHNITAITSTSELLISGNGLRIIKFSNDDGELIVEGNIDAVSYSDNQKSNGGIFSKIFR